MNNYLVIWKYFQTVKICIKTLEESHSKLLILDL